MNNSKEGILHSLRPFIPHLHHNFVVFNNLCGPNMALAGCKFDVSGRVSTRPRIRAVGFSSTMISEMEANSYCRSWVGISAAIAVAPKLTMTTPRSTYFITTFAFSTYPIWNGSPCHVSHSCTQGNTTCNTMSEGRWADAGAGNAASCEA